MRSYLGLGVLGAGIGAGLMFLLDPQMGKRRRAVFRDKTVSFSRHASAVVDKTARDLRNRTYGTVVAFKSGHIAQMRPSIFNANWPPAVRLIAGTAGGALTAVGTKRKGVLGVLLGGIGSSVLTLAITNFSVRDLLHRLASTPETETPEPRKESTTGDFQGHTTRRNAG